MKQLKIKIEGLTNTGKSTVARVIRETLETHGITCSLEDCDNSDHMSIPEDMYNDRLKSLHGTLDIEIETVQALRVK